MTPDYNAIINQHNMLVIHSKDLHLLNEAVAKLLKVIHTDKTIHKVYTIDQNFSFNSLTATTKNLDLFVQTQLIELRLFSTISKECIAFLCAQKQKHIIWIIAIHNKTIPQELIQQLNSTQIINISTPNFYNLPQWIQARFQEDGFSINIQTANIIAQNYYANFYALSNLLQQLKLLYNQGNLETKQIEPLLAHYSMYTVFDLLNAIEDNNALLIIKILQNLQEQSTPMQLIFWGLSNTLKMFIAVKLDPKPTYSKKYNLWPTRYNKIKQLLTKHSSEHYLILSNQLFSLETMIKTHSNQTTTIWQKFLQISMDLTTSQYVF